MSGFWDTVNQDVNKLFGGTAQESDLEAFPGMEELGVAPSPLQSPETQPDAVKQALIDQGYVPPASSDPFKLDQSQQFGLITQNTSPFTVIDLNPAQANGTAQAGASQISGQTAYNNQFPTSPQTLGQISALLNIPILTLFKNPHFVANANAPGVTYSLPISGSSLRVDRLPQGFAPSGVSSGIQLASSNISTGLPINDVYVQNALNILLSGCFIQFDSTDNPMFMAKSGQIFNLKFKQIFITCFGSGGRYRAIVGNNAQVTGEADERGLRQSLHIWDGGGLLDSTIYHPVPFFCELNGNGPAVIVDNSDDGSGLTQQSSGNLVGSVINNGYVIIWITAIHVRYGTGTTSATIQKGAISTAGKIFFKHVGSNSTSYSFNLSIPIRVTLAGFPYALKTSAPFTSGEQLTLTMGGVGNYMNVSGYALGGNSQIQSGFSVGTFGIVPFNPYPGDIDH